MIAARSSSLKRAQPAISGKVRRQPMQKPDAPSTAQTFTQGVAIGRGGLASVVILTNLSVRTSKCKHAGEGAVASAE